LGFAGLKPIDSRVESGNGRENEPHSAAAVNGPQRKLEVT
jgi:hypothetical protein